MTPTIPTPGDVVDRSRSSTNAVAPTAPDTPSGAALDALRETDIARAHSLFTAVRRRLARLDDVPDSAPITSHLAAYNTHAVLPDIQALLAIGTALLTEHTALRAERDEQARQALARYKELCASGDEVSRLNEANAALSTRLAVAGEDTARLDFLENSDGTEWDAVLSRCYNEELTVRQSIDAARRSPASGGSSDAR